MCLSLPNQPPFDCGPKGGAGSCCPQAEWTSVTVAANNSVVATIASICIADRSLSPASDRHRVSCAAAGSS
jgi:hypothetical protein